MRGRGGWNRGSGGKGRRGSPPPAVGSGPVRRLVPRTQRGGARCATNARQSKPKAKPKQRESNGVCRRGERRVRPCAAWRVREWRSRRRGRADGCGGVHLLPLDPSRPFTATRGRTRRHPARRPGRSAPLVGGFAGDPLPPWRATGATVRRLARSCGPLSSPWACPAGWRGPLAARGRAPPLHGDEKGSRCRGARGSRVSGPGLFRQSLLPRWRNSAATWMDARNEVECPAGNRSLDAITPSRQSASSPARPPCG